MNRAHRPGILLTALRSPTIVLRESRMNQSAYLPDRCAAPRWHAWVCFCLAFFLLYNPYQSALSSGDSLNVRHPASNRATVGASELQHFSPADERDTLSTHHPAAVVAFVLLPDVSPQAFAHYPQVASPPQQFYGSNLWFRPPPAL
jgi:hypothetical protein